MDLEKDNERDHLDSIVSELTEKLEREFEEKEELVKKEFEQKQKKNED
jgi:hypothetical protein